VPAELVDPPGGLESEGDRDRVLAVRAARGQHPRGALGQVRAGGEHLGQQRKDLTRGRAQHQDVTRLGDVLRGRPQCTQPPCSPAAALSSVTNAISG
jgi:hypothetical protein